MGLFDFLRRPKVILRSPSDIREIVSAASRMTAFDWASGQLCSANYREDQNPDRTVHYGALGVLQQALQRGASGDLDAMELLASKSPGDRDGTEWLTYCEGIARAITIDWPKIQEEARQRSLPGIVQVTNLLVYVHEKRFPRPSATALRGHFAVLADFVLAVAMYIVVVDCAVAEAIASDPC